MNKDKKVIYFLSSIMFVLLFSALFVNLGNSKIVAACLLFALAILICVFVKKRRSLSINKKEVLLLSSILAILYVVLYQMTGVFLNFYKNPYFVNTERLLTTVLPLTVIIVSAEIIRYVLLAQNNKYASVMAYLSCVLADILSFSNLVGITNFNRFMDLVGLTFFPAICANIYYHYISKRYGALPNIIFRLITTLYIYFIPIDTGMSDSLTACIKIILPIVMMALTSALFENKKKKTPSKKESRIGAIGTVITVIIVILIAMLISCQFRFGALVIATESMTGEINKGDMIIYERYDGQAIKEGQVIVFADDKSRIVHRVVQIQNIGGELRYFTKGDANEDLDNGYRVAEDIVGLTDIKVAYIGYPTLWLRDLINNLGKEGT